ncbi:MAG: NrdH-redoxin [Chloroflexi bacterium]|nr:NrdH-redoxin [Chloroflexota bacterium]MBT3669912.1 NrdH-redoxin [Chloroflexota bacterium]MBT4001798.1 NrdH-redoxin [Chloroflexota bacterium]MBT4304814.1 NrdH-redoxin [Chloroflexota bacterium]MBT4534685.1 NrdH-redoxin [Chloroflexota bacterium]
MKSQDNIIVYGTKWCPDSHRARLIFKKNDIDYTYIDIDENPEAVEIVLKINNGNRSVPTILFPDESILVEPSNRELKDKLAELTIAN